MWLGDVTLPPPLSRPHLHPPPSYSPSHVHTHIAVTIATATMDDDSVLDYARELVQGLLKSCLDKFRGDVSWPKGGQFSPEVAQVCIEELVQVSARESSSRHHLSSCSSRAGEWTGAGGTALITWDCAMDCTASACCGASLAAGTPCLELLQPSTSSS